MSLIGSSILAGASGAGGAYTINQSLRLNDDDSNYLEWTPSSAGNRQKWTWSAWVKRSALSSNDTLFSSKSNTAQIYLTTGDLIRVEQYDGGGGYDFRRDFDGKMRDTSAWYHLVVIYDSAQGTEADRIKCYRNGERLGVDYTYNTMSQSFESEFNNTEPHWLGKIGGGQYWDGYLAEVHFIDGQALDSSYFGETGTYGEWKPSEYTGTYGTNGFYLPFKQDYSVEGMSTTLYTGIGSNSVGTHYIGGVGFRPDLVWIKDRETTYQHVLFDSVRGPGRRAIQSNGSAAEGMPNNSYDRLVAFDADGFTHHGGQYGSAYVDRGGADYVAWCWDMGGRNTVTGFGATTWTGDGQQQLITGIGFQPDLVWLKRRSEADSHGIFDSVRGATKWLATDQNWTETTTSNSLLKFDKDGFTIGSYSNFNYTDSTFVAYGWDMGGTEVINTDGSITSTVRANQTYGQSIVSYTGTGSSATVGHGLSSTPEIIIWKRRDSTSNWSTQSTLWADQKELTLNQTDALSATDSRLGSQSNWDTTTFEVNDYVDQNASSGTYVAYCFHSVSGYSKIGTYDGTDSAGVTVTTGFRPAFVIIKCTNLTENWVLIDSMRSPYNDANDYFSPNLNNAESSSSAFDIEFTDTGFVLNGTDDAINGYNGGTGEYIYMAFAGGADTISDYNSDGSSHSRVRANTTYGQSIVTDIATGNDHTIGHGLSSAPEMIFRKKRYSGTSRNWAVWHKDLTDGYALEGLNTNGAEVSGGSPSKYIRSVNSTTFTVGNDVSVNESTGNYVSYCFHSVSGYSKIGSYTGNGGGTDNAITGLGFAPAWIMIKNISNSGSWRIIDKVRNPVNTSSQDATLYPDLTAGEGDSTNLDWDSDGFTLNSGETDGDTNTDGDTYIYMAFADTREYGFWLDQSGNNNDWTIGEGGTGNLDESDISLDTPSNNFATMNPLEKGGSATATFSEGNLKLAVADNSNPRGSFVMSSGKWYWEAYLVSGNSYANMGIAESGYSSGNLFDTSSTAKGYIYLNDGNKRSSLGASATSYGSSYTNGDIIGVAYDADNGTVTFYKNNSSQGTAYTGLSGGHTAYSQGYGGTATWVFNFGQDSSFAGMVAAQGNQDSNDIGDFYYTPPTGYLALCTANLSDPAVIPSEHFNTITYTGNSLNPASVTGVGFQPDLVWAKTRSFGNTNHRIQDAVRGSNKRLASDTSDAELNNDGGIQSFDSDGFTVGDGTSKDGYIHFGGRTFVAWNWKANGSGVSNTDGDITSTVSVNSDAGFSIVSYTGDGTDGSTIGHGLSQAPEIAIFKNRTTGASWATFGYPNTSVFTEDGSHLLLDQDYAISNSTTKEVSLGSSLITIVDAGGDINTNNDDYICYCFHSVDGFSKVGSFTANGSSDGTFVYTGFRPAFFMYKNIDTSNRNWGMFDNTRETNNVMYRRLFANLSNSEDTGVNPVMDFVSNGIKWRTSTAGVQDSGNTYIYIAFAENPFKYTNAR